MELFMVLIWSIFMISTVINPAIVYNLTGDD